MREGRARSVAGRSCGFRSTSSAAGAVSFRLEWAGSRDRGRAFPYARAKGARACFVPSRSWFAGRQARSQSDRVRQSGSLPKRRGLAVVADQTASSARPGASAGRPPARCIAVSAADGKRGDIGSEHESPGVRVRRFRGVSPCRGQRGTRRVPGANREGDRIRRPARGVRCPSRHGQLDSLQESPPVREEHRGRSRMDSSRRVAAGIPRGGRRSGSIGTTSITAADGGGHRCPFAAFTADEWSAAVSG